MKINDEEDKQRRGFYFFMSTREINAKEEK